MTRTLLISTGSELLRGHIADTNGAWMASRLDQWGIAPSKIIVAPDDKAELALLIQNALDQYDLTICGGGLGPTTDDITAEAAAMALGVPIVRNPEAEGQIRQRYKERNREMPLINLRQADLPLGATVLENKEGTAPGFTVQKGQARIYFLPGPPAEMKFVFETHIVPLLHNMRGHVFEGVFKCYGTGESNLQELLMPIQKAHSNVQFAYRASFPEIAIKITGTGKESVLACHGDAIKAVGNFAFSNDARSLPEVLGEELARKGLTVACAESCTGGLICHELTQLPGSSRYVVGGVVAYDNRVKIEQLNVDGQQLEQFGAVSKQIVCQMAEGARKTFKTSLAIATSGIAGPTGGTPEKPVGTVHIALATQNGILHKKCLFNGYSRTKVKTASAWTAMKMTLDHILEKQ